MLFKPPVVAYNILSTISMLDQNQPYDIYTYYVLSADCQMKDILMQFWEKNNDIDILKELSRQTWKILLIQKKLFAELTFS